MSFRGTSPFVSIPVWTFAVLFAVASPDLSRVAAADDDDDDFFNRVEIDANDGRVRIEGPDLRLKTTSTRARFDGPGYRTSLEGDDLQVEIDDARLGVRDDDDDDDDGPIDPVETIVIDLAGLSGSPILCGDNTYSFASGELVFTRRVTSDQGRPAPYSPGFNAVFPIATLIGEIVGTVTNQDGDVLDVLGLDSADEVLSEEGFTAATGIELNFLDADGNVVDHVGFSGNFNSGGPEPGTVIVDTGTCRQIVGPGIVVAGPFFVFPFAPDQLITIESF